MSAQTAGPDIEGVLVAHHHLDRMRGTCMNQQGAPCGWEGVGPENWRTHVAAELRAEVGRWLGSEAENVARAMCGETWDGDKAVPVLADLYRRHATKALAALAECVGVEEVGA